MLVNERMKEPCPACNECIGNCLTRERERDARANERERGRAIQLPGRSSLHVVIRKSQPQVFSSAFCLSIEFPMLLLHLSHCDTTHTHTYCVRVCVCVREIQRCPFSVARLRLSPAPQVSWIPAATLQRSTFNLPRKSTRTFHCCPLLGAAFSSRLLENSSLLPLSFPLSLSVSFGQPEWREKSLTGNLHGPHGVARSARASSIFQRRFEALGLPGAIVR